MVPKVEPQPVAKVEPQPVAKVEPQPVAKVEPRPIAKVEPRPIAKVEPQPITKVEPQPIAKVEPQPVAKVEGPKAVGKATLLGVAVPIPSPPQTEAPNKAPDDLDWELPTNPVASPFEEAAAAVEPPPKSNPSGIGEKYVPKDVNAPAIVLKEDVKRAEERARAELAAEHRARSAPTVLKFKAIEVAKNDDSDELEPSPFGPPKRRLGVWIGLGAGALSLALIGVLVAGQRTSREEPTAAPVEVKAAPPVAKPEAVADPAPPPAPEPKPPEPAVEPSAAPPAVVVAPASQPEPVPEPPKPVATAKPASPAKAPKPAAPKPASTSKPTSSPPKPPASKPGAGGIVRDAPF
jgi:hypothetical protein